MHVFVRFVLLGLGSTLVFIRMITELRNTVITTDTLLQPVRTWPWQKGSIVGTSPVEIRSLAVGVF